LPALPQQLVIFAAAPNLPIHFACIDGGTVFAAVSSIVESESPIVLVTEKCVPDDNALKIKKSHNTGRTQSQESVGKRALTPYPEIPISYLCGKIHILVRTVPIDLIGRSVTSCYSDAVSSRLNPARTWKECRVTGYEEGQLIGRQLGCLGFHLGIRLGRV